MRPQQPFQSELWLWTSAKTAAPIKAKNDIGRWQEDSGLHPVMVLVHLCIYVFIFAILQSAGPNPLQVDKECDVICFRYLQLMTKIILPVVSGGISQNPLVWNQNSAQ